MQKEAIIYCRFSERPDADTTKSNKKQEERCRAYCTAHGYKVAGVFRDRAVSGKKLYRPELKKALNSLRAGMIFVVDTSDRLARDELVELTILDLIERAKCTVEYADGSPNQATPEGKVYRGVLRVFAQYERDRTALRTKIGLAKLRANGVYLGKPPVGYMRDKKTKRLIECPQEQAAIQKILALSKIGPAEIAASMNSYGMTEIYGCFRGKPWCEKTIRKILKGKAK